MGEIAGAASDRDPLDVMKGLRERVFRFFLKNYTHQNRADAEDLTQQTYLCLAKSLTWQEGSVELLEAYVFRVARNVGSDWRKAEARRRLGRLARDTDQELHGDTVPSTPCDDLIGLQSAQRAQEALDRLPDRARLVFWLRHEGVSIEDIATTLAISAATVSRDLSLVLLAIKNAMDDDGGGSFHDRA